jgi:hypothetical protein
MIESETQWAEVRGCAYGHPGVFRLGVPMTPCTPSGCGGISLETVAGPLVGFAYASIGPGLDYEVLVVRDLRNGRTVRRVITSPAAIVLKSDGAVAWVANGGLETPVPANNFLPGDVYDVELADNHGHRVLTPFTPTIDRFSLALGGSTVYWTQARKPFSVPLD